MAKSILSATAAFWLLVALYPAQCVAGEKSVVLSPPPDIPTVSEWGLIIMAVLLVTAGAVVIMRRRRAVA